MAFPQISEVMKRLRRPACRMFWHVWLYDKKKRCVVLPPALNLLLSHCLPLLTSHIVISYSLFQLLDPPHLFRFSSSSPTPSPFPVHPFVSFNCLPRTPTSYLPSATFLPSFSSSLIHSLLFVHLPPSLVHSSTLYFHTTWSVGRHNKTQRSDWPLTCSDATDDATEILARYTTPEPSTHRSPTLILHVDWYSKCFVHCNAVMFFFNSWENLGQGDVWVEEHWVHHKFHH